MMDWLSDPGGMILELMRDFFAAQCNAFLGLMVMFVRNIVNATPLTAPWESMLGDSAVGGMTVSELASAVSNAAIEPVAHSLLALVMLVQLVKISQRVDGTQTFPAVKEVFMLLVFCAFFMLLINNADTVCIAVYDITRAMIQQVTGMSGSMAEIEAMDLSDVPLGDVMSMVVMVMIAYLVSMVAYIIALLVCYARALQLYVMLTFAPIPFALLGFDETRQYGMGFIKNFAAVCLAGVIMAFIFMCFPALLVSVLGEAAGTVTIVAGSSSLALPKLLAILLLLCFALVKSGAWARDILGG
jgi:hypothetical protein